MRFFMISWGVMVAVAGCGDDSGPDPDAGRPLDAGPGVDAGGSDAGAGTDAGPGVDAGPPREPVWDCLGSVAVPSTTAESITFDFTITDSTSGEAIAGAVAKACALDDPGCEGPLGEATAAADGTGSITINPIAPEGFFAYSDITADGYVPVLGFNSMPFLEDDETAATLITESQIDLLATLVGAEVDLETTGLLSVVAQDCEEMSASGAQASLSVEAEQFYFVGEVPSRTATETDETGLVSHLGVAPGPVEVTVTNADGTTTATANVTVRAGALTVVFMRPTPDGAVLSPPSP